MSSYRHTDEEVKDHLIWKSEVYKDIGSDLTSANNFCEPFALGDIPQNSPAGFPNPTPPLTAVYTSSAMDICETNTSDLHVVPPIITDPSSGLVSRTFLIACEQRVIELGPAVDASSLEPHMDPNEEKQIGQATGGSEVAVVISRSEGLDIQGDRHSNSRSVKPQGGDRSRFKPWGYI